MDNSRPTMAHRVAQAARASQRQRTGHAPTAVTALLSEGTLVITLHGALSPAERAEAPRLYQSLRTARDEVLAGKRDLRRIELQAMATLAAKGWRPDYVSVRRQADLQPPGNDDRQLVVLAAAFLGRTRLIDNVEVTL